MNFYGTVIKKNLFLVGKNVLIAMVPILINKDVFEPSYNDLKFTVRTRNYVCTNIIHIGTNVQFAVSFSLGLSVWWILLI